MKPKTCNNRDVCVSSSMLCITSHVHTDSCLLALVPICRAFAEVVVQSVAPCWLEKLTCRVAIRASTRLQQKDGGLGKAALFTNEAAGSSISLAGTTETSLDLVSRR